MLCAANPTHADSHSNEVMRLYPVVPSGSQRAPERGTGGATIGPQ